MCFLLSWLCGIFHYCHFELYSLEISSGKIINCFLSRSRSSSCNQRPFFRILTSLLEKLSYNYELWIHAECRVRGCERICLFGLFKFMRLPLICLARRWGCVAAFIIFRIGKLFQSLGGFESVFEDERLQANDLCFSAEPDTFRQSTPSWRRISPFILAKRKERLGVCRISFLTNLGKENFLSFWN